MKGVLTIDGKDAYLEYRLVLVEDVYSELLSVPDSKNVLSVDYPEKDGLEVDLSDIKLKAQDIDIKVVVKERKFTDSLIGDLSVGAYHIFEFKELGISKKLRIKQITTDQVFQNWTMLTLKCSEDCFFESYEHLRPLKDVGPQDGLISFDGVLLSDYGIVEQQDCKKELEKQSGYKERLKIENSQVDGIIYDDGLVNGKKQRSVVKSKDVKLSLVFIANDRKTLLRNFYSFFWMITRTGDHLINYNGTDYRCYYKSSTLGDSVLSRRKSLQEVEITFVMY